MESPQWLSEKFALGNSLGQIFPDNHCGLSTVYTIVHRVVCSAAAAIPGWLNALECGDGACSVTECEGEITGHKIAIIAEMAENRTVQNNSLQTGTLQYIKVQYRTVYYRTV